MIIPEATNYFGKFKVN